MSEEITAQEALDLVAEAIGLDGDDITPENVVIYTQKVVATRDRAMDTVERRQHKLAEALGVDEGVAFFRLIEMIRQLRD